MSVALTIMVGLTSLYTGTLIGRHRRRPPKPRPREQPWPTYCRHKYTNEAGVTFSCLGIWSACKSGFCSGHCKESLCGCMASNQIEQEVLRELREVTAPAATE